MPNITERAEYGAANSRIERLGLRPLIDEIEKIVTGFDLRVKEAVDAISIHAMIDVGVIVVPDDTLADYLTDRIPRFSDAVRHVRAARAEDFPLLILGVRHDGPGDPLPKQKKK